MSIPRHSLCSTAILIAIAALVIGGCGSDETSSPVNGNPLDEAPPLAPTGVAVGMHNTSKFAITWTENAEPDLAGYRVYLYDPSPMRPNSFVCLTPGRLLSRSSMTVRGEDGTSYLFRIGAVDFSGNESLWSEPFSFTFHGGLDDGSVDVGQPISEVPTFTLPGYGAGRDSDCDQAGGWSGSK